MKKLLVIGTIAGIIALLLGATWFIDESRKSEYNAKHHEMEEFLAREVLNQYYGKHGETLTPEQYDWVYNEATEALTALGIDDLD